MTERVLDWTEGREGIAYQRCNDCGHVQYFRRDFCAACGKHVLSLLQSAGIGTIYAFTVAHRAPTETLRAFAPYSIALIDMAEGFRLMAHARTGVHIGDPVRAEYMNFGDILIPVFDKLAER